MCCVLTEYSICYNPGFLFCFFKISKYLRNQRHKVSMEWSIRMKQSDAMGVPNLGFGSCSYDPCHCHHVNNTKLSVRNARQVEKIMSITAEAIWDQPPLAKSELTHHLHEWSQPKPEQPCWGQPKLLPQRIVNQWSILSSY